MSSKRNYKPQQSSAHTPCGYYSSTWKTGCQHTKGSAETASLAERGRNQNPNPALQGADLAPVQILQMMQNRNANRDNSQKQFLMFPKESFTGQDKKKAKSHWAKFSKYLDYQNQQGTIPRDLQHLPEIISMFKLTLQDIALGWFETESPNWQTEDQVKQAFLKRFNPWGDTRCQQQDAWNKLKFDMTKDDVDAFVVDMKMLASILGHNDNVIKEKFKDIFPDPDIEAALIAMDNFGKLRSNNWSKYTSPLMIAILHQQQYWYILPMIPPKKEKVPITRVINISCPLSIHPKNKVVGEVENTTVDNEGEGMDKTVALEDVAVMETLTIDMKIMLEGEVKVKVKGSLQIIEEEVKIIFLEGDEDNGMVMTQVSVKETIGTEIMMAKIMGTEVGDGMAV